LRAARRGYIIRAMSKSTAAVGMSVPRKDGMGKATGRALYADDLVFPGMLYGRTIRTTIACGRLTGVR
jgi:CO/xanthine dehydrogenase Mo-binding subunit